MPLCPALPAAHAKLHCITRQDDRKVLRVVNQDEASTTDRESIIAKCYAICVDGVSTRKHVTSQAEEQEAGPGARTQVPTSRRRGPRYNGTTASSGHLFIDSLSTF